MKIYTRKKKPALYGFLVFSIVVVAAVAVLFGVTQTTGFNGLPYITLIMPAYFAITLAVLIAALIKQLQYNPYSYNTIYYFGFSLLVSTVLVTHIVTAVNYFSSPEGYRLRDMAEIVRNSARQYMIITLPFLAVFSVGLLISNIVLMKKEGKKVKNMLGIILAISLLGGEALLIWLGSVLGGVWDKVTDLLCAVFIYAECMLFGTIFADVFAAVHLPERNKDYIIILGCRMSKDGTPTPLLRARIDKAIEFYDRQVNETGRSAIFVPSGGKGGDEPLSEAECMARYLISKGFAPEQIILEDESRNTMENMIFSFRKLPEDAKCAFSTTNYHVFRSGIASNRACKHKAEGIGADTKWYFWPNASVREFIGLLKGHRGKQLLVLSGLIAIYLFLSFI
ncbi:MAG: YdcF family protein [Clostridia bacterium]|nr:YdcF family protein [Clostridia bacterium]